MGPLEARYDPAQLPGASMSALHMLTGPQWLQAAQYSFHQCKKWCVCKLNMMSVYMCVYMQGAVSAAGPMYALLGFALLPFIWSMPEALVCAELASAFPENSGYVVWVEAAFGPFAGFLEGLFSWISGVTDNTIYPVMLITYLQVVFPALQGWWLQKCDPVSADLCPSSHTCWLQSLSAFPCSSSHKKFTRPRHMKQPYICHLNKAL